MAQYDDTLNFDTHVNGDTAKKELDSLGTYAATVAANITSSIAGAITSGLAEIPKQIAAIGSQFESSMAQVAATMGITQIDEEFQQLSETAKEMGENTKFSASQAADALNYLALAGYDADKACSALPTVLDLAAAGGMELANASDMVTDSMSALGLEMDELTGFADQMAVTSQKSNTSVSQLGNAILSVGANARVLAGRTNELMTELGILADNGKKGAEAGTALARVIKNLSTPVSNAKDELDALGVKCYDAEGNFRNMQDIFLDLNEAMKDFTEEERQAALSEIFDTAALSSAKTLLANCGERFDELSGYISKADGAAKQMGETMSDTLAGDVTTLNSALDGLAVTAYDKFAGTMREAVQSVTADVKVLSESLKNGELSESMDKLADSFADVAVAASKLLSDTVIPAVIKGFEFIVDNGNAIISVFAGIAASTIVTKGGALLTPFIMSLQTASLWAGAFATQEDLAALSTMAASGQLSAAQIAVALYNGQISIGTAATAAFNAVLAANPLGLVAAAIGVVVTAVVALTGKIKESSKEVDAAGKQLDKYAESMDAVKQKNEENIAKSNAEIAVIKDKTQRYEELRQRYADLTEGEMSQFLSLQDELIQLLPEGTSLIESQAGGYDNLADSIAGVCAQLERRALLEAKQAAYVEAVAQNYDIDKWIKEAEDAADAFSDEYDPYGMSKDWTLNEYCMDHFGLSYNDLKEVKSDNQKIIDEYNALATDVQTAADKAAAATSGSTDSGTGTGTVASTVKSDTPEQARINAEKIESAKRTEQAKQDALTKLNEEWEDIEHRRKIGEIVSDEEMYAEKKRVWERYGNEQRKDMWRYYEDLVSLENSLSEKAQSNAEENITGTQTEVLEDNKQLLTNTLEEMSGEWRDYFAAAAGYGSAFSDTLGVLGEDWKKKITFIAEDGMTLAGKKQELFNTFSDVDSEWENSLTAIADFGKSIGEKMIDDRKELLNEELNAVRTNIDSILSEYDNAYKEIESNVADYKAKLLSVAGSVFEVTETENEDGTKTRTYKVNDIKAQIDTMKKYHEALIQLRDGGAPQSLLAEMMNLDPDDGLQMAEYILGSGDLEELNELYRQRDAIAQEMAQEFYSPEIEALNNDTAAKITAEYENLPDEFYTIGKNAVENLYLGMNDAAGNISDIFRDNFSEIENFDFADLQKETALSADKIDLVQKASAVVAQSSASASDSGNIFRDLSAEFSRVIDSIKDIKIFNQITSLLTLDGKTAAESVNRYNNTIGRLADI